MVGQLPLKQPRGGSSPSSRTERIMIKKIVVSYVVNRMWKLVRRYGMQAILTALVEMTEDSNEDYMRQLNRDLRKALDNYKNRYER